MSLKKRLILSNIAMILLPCFAFILIEIILGYTMFYMFEGDAEANVQLFLSLRLISLLVVITLVNGILTYFVSKSIINPVRKLVEVAEEISEGNLEFSIEASSKDELGKLSLAFETMRQKLKKAEDLQKRYESNRIELIASISHDLKTPITSIKGYIKGLLDGVTDTPEKKQRYMETIYKKADDMDELINELFLYSKLDLEREPYQFEEINLQAYFSDFIEELSFDLEVTGGSVSYHYEPNESYIVRADRDKLKRVITNIIQNSLKYMDKDVKKISVELKSESDQVVVEMKDNGMGITEDVLPYVFESFYRTDSSRNSSTGGSGLGLAIAKRIVEDHGGRIWADSTWGEGTSMYFTLKKP